MQAPAAVHWDAEAESERDRLLQPLQDAPALLKDPRMLLCWPFWSATALPQVLVGTVRHPLAAARSMSAWRRIELDDGLALWLAHCRVLLELARSHGLPLVDLDAEPAAFLARMHSVVDGLPGCQATAAMDSHYEAGELHHDGSATEAASPRLREALAVHAELLALMPPSKRRTDGGFPWLAIERIRHLLATGDMPAAIELSRQTITTSADPVAVLLPLSAELLRARAHAAVLELCAVAEPPPAVAGLLRGKALLAAGRAADAVEALTTACAGTTPFWEARSLLAHALHGARRHHEARALLIAIAPEAVHPSSCLSTAAEWAWRDRDHDEALDLFFQAIFVSPPHRRGRIRCRRAELLRHLGRPIEATTELRVALTEDPAYDRARQLVLGDVQDTPILPPARQPE